MSDILNKCIYCQLIVDCARVKFGLRNKTNTISILLHPVGLNWLIIVFGNRFD